MKQDIERRLFTVDQPLELRAAAGGDGATPAMPTIRGHAAVFNILSAEMYGFREVIAAGAFATAIVEDDVRALWNHNPDMPIGRNRAKPTPTLRMAEDAIGLGVEIDLPENDWGRNAHVSIARGDVSQMSFAFKVVDQEWRTEGEIDIRTIKKVRLFDVSPVTYPAYPETDVALRALADLAAEGKRHRQDPEAWRVEHEQRRARLALLHAAG